MKHFARAAASAVVAACLTGCASGGATFFNRPVVEDSVNETASTVSLSADRRTVVVVRTYDKDGNPRPQPKFCAEPPPDSATGVTAEVAASLAAEVAAAGDVEGAKVDGRLKDGYKTEITVLANRTPALDAFRVGVYALCQYNVNGSVANDSVPSLFRDLMNMYVATSAAESKALSAKPEKVTKTTSGRQAATPEAPGNPEVPEDGE